MKSLPKGVTLLGRHLLGRQFETFLQHERVKCQAFDDADAVISRGDPEWPVFLWSTNNRQALSEALKLRLNRFRVFRYWIGGDVLRLINVPWIKRKLVAMGNNRLFRRQFANSAQLSTELQSVGIGATTFLFSAVCCEKHWPASEFPQLPYRVLYYSIEGNDHIYLPEVLEAAAIANPEVKFVCIGNPSLKPMHPNITSLGLVSAGEMKKIYAESHCLLRFTSHDGFPRSIFEALVNGLDIVTNLDIPHAVLAPSRDDVATVIAGLARAKKGRNIDGRKWVLENHSSPQWTNRLLEALA